MKEQDLKNIWQSPENQNHLQFDKSTLFTDIEKDMSNFKKAVKYRDWREIGVALFMIPMFGFVAYLIPFLLSKIGAVIIIGWAILLIIRLFVAKRKVEVLPTETYIVYLNKSREFLLAQKRLLETVVYWYIIPLMIGVLLFFMGFNLTFQKKIFYLIITFGVGIATFFLNRYAVKKELLPQLKKVDEIINDLKE